MQCCNVSLSPLVRATVIASNKSWYIMSYIECTFVYFLPFELQGIHGVSNAFVPNLTEHVGELLWRILSMHFQLERQVMRTNRCSRESVVQKTGVGFRWR